MTRQTSQAPGLSGHRARKRFGQNFLVDQGVINAIVRHIRPQPDDQLVEIGPGQGALTGMLLEGAQQLAVIELDRDLVPLLHARYGSHPQFQVYQADALQFDFASLVKDAPLRVVGNLPYNISTPLIFHLLQYREQIADMHFMLQKEVVERMVAQPGDKNYGRLGIMTQYYCAVENLFQVPPESFRPIPKVDSAVVRLTPHRQLPLVAEDLPLLENLVRTAFGQRRKTLRNALKQLVPAATMDAMPIDLSRRPETLSLAEYVALSNFLSQQQTL